MNKLYSFYLDCGRMGSLEGVFAADEEDIKGIIGRTVYFGEVLGKHSDIYDEMTEKNFTLLTDDKEFIDKAKQYKLIPNGYNPFSYLDEE